MRKTESLAEITHPAPARNDDSHNDRHLHHDLESLLGDLSESGRDSVLNPIGPARSFLAGFSGGLKIKEVDNE